MTCSNPPQHVLIVRPSALGDVCRTVPALVSLRHALPDAQIDWLIRDTFVDAVAHHPALSTVLPFPRRRFGAMWRSPAAVREFTAWVGELRRRRYDLAIDLQGLSRSALFARLSGAGRRVGRADAREAGWLFYNQRHRIDDDQHTVDRMLALVEAAGYPGRRDLRLYVGPQDQAWMTRYLADHDVADEPYVCIAPTAQWRCKCWPIERFIELTRRLLGEWRPHRRAAAQSGGGHVVVLAAPSERVQIAPLLDAFVDDRRVHWPTTTVGQLMAIIARTELLVCNDSAPLHIAVGFDRRIVCLFGPTDPSRVGPYQRDDTVLQPPGITPRQMTQYRRRRDDQSLIAQISLKRVWNRVEHVLLSDR
jgi:heptosyltransferase-1